MLKNTYRGVAADPSAHRLHAVRADLARRAGNIDLARDSYLAALELCTDEVECQHLARRLDALGR